MNVPLEHILFFAGALFLLGLCCAVIRRSVLMILVGVEVMLNAAAVAFVGAGMHFGALDGQSMVVFILAAAAAEAAVGLALFVAAERMSGTAEADRYNRLKG